MRLPGPITGLAAALMLAGYCASAATLKHAVTVTGHDIRLSDIFTGPDVAGDIVVARAPAPGQKQIFRLHRLKSIARAHGLDWKPADRQSRTVITRAARLIEITEIEIALRRILTRLGLSKDHRIELFNRAIHVYAAVGATQPYEIRNARLDTGSGRFTASLVVTDNAEIQKIVGLNGRVFSIVEIPVPSRPLRPGEVITRADLEWIGVRSNTVDRNAIIDLGEIIGRTPRRPLRAGASIRRSDIRAPVVVAKGSFVTIELRTRHMTLSARVKAAENGAMGQTIRVLNTRSNLTIEGVVIGPGRVAVPSLNSTISGS